MRIREATVEDAAAIAFVHVRGWQGAYRGMLPDDFLDALDPVARADGWRSTLADPDSRVFVAERDEGVIGLVHACPSRDDDADSNECGEVTSIYVLPTAWRTGVGRGLTSAALVAVAGSGRREVTLWVLDSNERAIRFYQAAGWRADGARKAAELAGTAVTEVRYRRLLDPRRRATLWERAR